MQAYDEFVQILQQENQLIAELLKLGQKKQSVINDATYVSQIACQEQTFLNKLNKLETNRIELADVICPEKNLEEWIETTKKENVEFSNLIDGLRDKFAKLSQVNEINKQLIEESLAFAQFSINLLVDDSPKTYAKQGRKLTDKSFFDRKV